MRRHGGGREALSRAEHETRHQARDAGIDVHHGAAGEVQHAPVPHQAAVAAPHHVRGRRVDDGEPQRHEPQHGRELHAFGKRADDERRRDDGERHLKAHEHRFRDGHGQTVDRQARQERLAERADKAVEVDHPLLHAAGVERQAVAVDRPQHGDQRRNGKALHQHRQHVLAAHQAGVEQRETRNGHEQHQRRRGQHPGRVAGVQRRRGGFFRQCQTGQAQPGGCQRGGAASHQRFHRLTPQG